MKRRCPVCHKPVSFWAVIKPGLCEDRKIACNHCKNEISEYWEKHSMVVWFVLGLVAVGFVELLESAWFLDLSYLVAFWGFLMVLAYYLVPFKKP